MTISANAVWEFRSTATAGNVNGGFFVTGATGVDYSQQNAAQYALTGVTSAGAGATVLSASAASDMVGNGARIVSGTNFIASWAEIISVVVGVSITFDKAVTTGVGAAGVINVGGAISLSSTLDDDVFEAMEPGNVGWIKAGGTFSTGESISVSKSGNISQPIKFLGYQNTRGDNPSIANSPYIVTDNSIIFGNFWQVMNLNVLSGAVTGLAVGSSSLIQNCKVINNSPSPGRAASRISSQSQAINCELVCLRGTALDMANFTFPLAAYCYIHDSDILVGSTGTGQAQMLLNNILARPYSYAYRNTGSMVVPIGVFLSNTFYGSAAKIGEALSFTTAQAIRVMNNIFSGFTTAIVGAAPSTGGYGDYNAFDNNTNNVDNAANWQMGPHVITGVDPQFTNTLEVTGSGATTSNAGNTLILAGATFQTQGVTAARDYVTILSGSGTLGKYTIASVDSETQITLGQAPGNSSSNVGFSIGVGQNFSIGTNLQADGFPGLFPGGLTQGYLDLGAVQRLGGGGATSFTFGT